MPGRLFRVLTGEERAQRAAGPAIKKLPESAVFQTLSGRTYLAASVPV
jgi:hypothetical protein